MAKVAAFAAMVAGASAFTGPMPVNTGAFSAKTASATKPMSQVVMMAEASKAVPFLPKPANLDESIPGYAGFDPVGFSDFIDVRFLREAEVKHGRIAMLAVAGWWATDFGLRLPGDVHAVSTIDAHDAAVKFGGLSQVLLWTSLFEIISLVGVVQMLEGSGRQPAEFGFDPLKLWGTGQQKATRELQEVKNGRLAMLAFSGIVTQAVLTGHSFPYV